MPHESDDCYFYYYRTCNKGSNCPYRHEPSARGTEEICQNWEFGNCVKKICNLRHMRIEVQRSTIQCYWELQPAGCQKPYCVFKHTKKSNADNCGSALAKSSPSQIDDTDVPSPKVKPLLISIQDTDEDSPKKKVSYKSISPEKSKTDLQKSLAKPDLTGPNPTFKSLRELKREKVLRARREFEERRRLALESTSGGRSPISADLPGGNSTVENETSDVNGAKFSAKQMPKMSSLQKNPNPADMEVRVGTLKDVEVKSFKNIMEEKRRKRLEEVNSGHSDKQTDNSTQKPLIAPRKIKIHRTNSQKASKKPFRLKRPALESSPHENGAKHTKLTQEPVTGGSDGEVSPMTLLDNEQSEAKLEDQTGSAEDISPLCQRDESEEDMEAHLLDSSTYNVKGEKAYSIDPEIDDDDEIFNKMEHLLA